MTAISAIISRAYRQENITSKGQSPDATEQEEGLEVVRSAVEYLLNFELGELAESWKIPNVQDSTYEVRDPLDEYGTNSASPNNLNPTPNKRLILNISQATTIYFPTYPSNGARMSTVDAGATQRTFTISANGLLIEGADSVVVDLDDDPIVEWFYRADKAEWVRVTELASDSESPFPSMFDPLLINLTAIWLCPRNGREPSSVTTSLYKKFLGRFEAYYKQEVPTKGIGRLDAVQSSGPYTNGLGREF